MLAGMETILPVVVICLDDRSTISTARNSFRARSRRSASSNTLARSRIVLAR
jgi:hypothetical protein